MSGVRRDSGQPNAPESAASDRIAKPRTPQSRNEKRLERVSKRPWVVCDPEPIAARWPPFTARA